MRADTDELPHRLRRHVDVLAELIGERNSSNPSGLETARAYIRRELADMGHASVDQPFRVHDREAINIEVALPGRRAERSTLIVGAHYDTARGTPGADDNASAVSMLLEIARELVGRQLRRPVRLVVFDCEEMPHFGLDQMGSQHHATELRRTGERVLGMVCLESVGFYPRGPVAARDLPWPLRWANRLLGQRYVVIVSDLRSVRFGLPFVCRFATSGTFPFLPAALPVRWVPDIERSDHRGYWEQGFAALMVTDTANLRNPNYHEPTDRLATLDLPRMARLCRQLQRTIRRLCA
jgi:hypothetical protein